MGDSEAAQRAYVERAAERRVQDERLATTKSLRRRRAGLTTGAVVVFLLVVVGLSAGVRALGHREASQRLAAQVRPLARFVERQRGLVFTAPVHVRLVSPTAFGQMESPYATALGQKFTAIYPTLFPLGLFGPNFDSDQAARANVDHVDGLYDKGQITVIGTAWTPNVRRAVVHELTHALDDQRFGLSTVRQRALCPRGCWPVDGLIEGDAIVVERAYIASLPNTDQLQIQAATQSFLATAAHQDATTRTIFGFAYDYGPPFVQRLIAAGGQRRINQAFADPPRIDSEVIHPERYLDPEQHRFAYYDALGFISPPTPIGPVHGQVSKPFILGEPLIRLLLSEVTSPDQAAALAATSQEGGEWVTWWDGNRYCAAGHMVADPIDTNPQLQNAFTTWAANKLGITIDTSVGVNIQACRQPPPPG